MSFSAGAKIQGGHGVIQQPYIDQRRGEDLLTRPLYANDLEALLV
jgi:hypothetical protein